MITWIGSLSILAQDPWLIEVAPLNVRDYYGATVANGQLGITSSQEPLKTGNMVLAGVYDTYGRGRVANFVPTIRMLDVNLRINGSSVTMHNIQQYKQTLDMYSASLNGSFVFKEEASIKYSYKALRSLPFSAILEVEIIPRKDWAIRVENLLEAHESFKDPCEYFITVKNGDHKYSIASSTAFTPSGKIEMGSSAVIIPDPSYPTPVIEHWSNLGVGIHSQLFEMNLTKGKPYKFYVIGSTLSSVTHHDIRNEVDRLAFFCAVEGPQRLIEKHESQWKDLWNSDIMIEGDAQSQQDVHQMLFNLYGNVREGSSLSISPMGLSGFGYNGHVFWDCETWVYPALLLLHSELAKTWMDYRIKTLQAAQMNAYTYGCKGAKYPWECASTGFEETPSHNLYGALEVHISADIAIAAWQYYLVTRDTRWLRENGFPVIKNCADYFVSRVEPDNQNGYNLIHVIGADEWNVNPSNGKNVNNNAYSIGAIITNMKIADKAAKLLQEDADTMWMKVANGLNIRLMDNGVTKEHDDYQLGTKTKQADVLLLSYPLNIITDSIQIRKNLDYYLNTVPRKSTPAMSKSVYSIIYSRMKDRENAWRYFQDSYKPNLQGPFGVIAEFDGGTNPYFITGAGGTLQAVLMGFGGLSITEDGVMCGETLLPSKWKSLTLKGIGKEKKQYVIK